MKTLKQFIAEQVNKKMVTETSRAQKARQIITGTIKPEHGIKTFAIITSENPMANQLSTPENKKLYKDMLKFLADSYYRFYKIKGQYDSKENSVIVYNITLSDTKNISAKYGQKAFIWCDLNYSESGKSSVSYQYWEREDFGKPFKKESEKNRIIDANDFENYWSQIKRSFKFQIPFFEHADDICRTISKRKGTNNNEIIHYLKSSLNESLIPKTRWTSRGILYGRQYKNALIHEASCTGSCQKIIAKIEETVICTPDELVILKEPVELKSKNFYNGGKEHESYDIYAVGINPNSYDIIVSDSPSADYCDIELNFCRLEDMFGKISDIDPNSLEDLLNAVRKASLK